MAIAIADVLQASDSHGHDYFRSLPREYYTSPDLFEVEYRKIFSRQWLVAGHVSQVRDPGDFFTVEIAGESIIITRDDEGELRAFYNVCRHRGARVCRSSAGQARAFTCPYHGWVYGRNGELRSAPTMRDGEDISYGELGLKPAHVAEVGGFVFLHLGQQEPEPVAEAFAELPNIFARHGIPRARMVHELLIDIEANWKLVVENAMECYHCEVCHQTLSSAIQLPDFEKDPPRERFQIAGRNFAGGAGAGGKLQPGWSSFTVDGGFASKRFLGGMTAEDGGSAGGFHVGPVFGGSLVYADYFTMSSSWPITNDLTRYRVQFFVHEDAVEGVDYELDRVTKVMTVTMGEDAEIVGLQAKGVASRTFQPGPLAKRAEPVNHLMLGLYLDWMDAEQDG